jgi:EAL domain-containing protein (putative c-di-GMP-specific phosphodiesterase class I)
VEEPLFFNPATLFDVAVSAGRIWKLGRLVRRRASQAMGALVPSETLFLNLHPAEIEDPHWLEDGDLLQCAPSLVLEITERASLPDLSRFRMRMKQLREAGYRFAIDDLGAGYASLNALALLEPDFVKLDRLTVQALPDSRPLQALVRRIVDFANDVGIFVIGEGVETKNQFRLLQEVGCHWGQGYFFGRPSPQFDRSRCFFGEGPQSGL